MSKMIVRLNIELQKGLGRSPGGPGGLPPASWRPSAGVMAKRSEHRDEGTGRKLINIVLPVSRQIWDLHKIEELQAHLMSRDFWWQKCYKTKESKMPKIQNTLVTAKSFIF